MDIHVGTLVRTTDGFYCIVVDLITRAVFKGDGTEEELSDEEWKRLVAMPMNIFADTGCKALFLELVEGRAPCQMRRKAQEHQTLMDYTYGSDRERADAR